MMTIDQFMAIDMMTIDMAIDFFLCSRIDGLCVVFFIPGAEGAVFRHSIETPHVRAEPFKELR